MSNYYLIKKEGVFNVVPYSLLANHLPCVVVGSISLDFAFPLNISDLLKLAEFFNNYSHD